MFDLLTIVKCTALCLNINLILFVYTIIVVRVEIKSANKLSKLATKMVRERKVETGAKLSFP